MTFDKKRTLSLIKDVWGGCTSCSLHKSREGEALVGNGNPDADIMFVEGVPDAADMYTSKLFSGDRQAALSALCERADIKYEDTFRTTVVGCQSLKIIPATEDKEEQILDSDPAKECVAACRPRLERVIYTVDPLIIIALGDLAWKTLVQPQDRGDAKTLNSAWDMYFTRVHGVTPRTLRYPVLVVPSLRALLDMPSKAAHGPRATTITTLQTARALTTWIRNND